MSCLPKEKKEILTRALTPRLNKYIPHKPTPKQRAFLLVNDLDAFFGGAAGGGKSDALLMAALQYVDQPNYSALLVRDTFTNLTMPGALIERAEEWLAETDAVWYGDRKTWVFPPYGSTLTFGYMDSSLDHLKYKSAEFQFVGVDEAGDLRWKQIRYLFSRLRRLKGSNIPIRFRLASNPGGISHDELKRNYIDARTRGKRIFIPSKLRDNPYLDREEYEKSLNELDLIERARLLDGDWDISETGEVFQRDWFKVIDQLPAGDEVVSRVRFWDLAATEVVKKNKITNDPCFTVGVKIAVTKSKKYIVESVVRFRENPSMVEKLIRQTADMDGKSVPICMEHEPGSGGKNTIDHYRRNILPDFIFSGEKPEGSKIERAKPFASQAAYGNVYLLNGVWVEEYLAEVHSFPNGKFKDQVDASSAAFMKLARPSGVRATIVGRK